MDQKNDNHQIDLQDKNEQSKDNSQNQPLMDYMETPKSKNNMIFGGIIGVTTLIILGIVGYYIYNYFNQTPKNIFSDENKIGSNTPAEIDIITEPEQLIPNGNTSFWPPEKPSYLTPKVDDSEGILTNPNEISNYNKAKAPTAPTPTQAPQEPKATTELKEPTQINQNPVIVNRSVIWTPNDYKYGDIKGNSYVVILGDTLWEISEGRYGQGSQWKKIEKANEIDYLRNGNPLITPGQNLKLPE
jgi:hypothetical protein